MKANLVIDIETVTLPVTSKDLEAYLAAYVPHKGLKDPVKVAAHKAEYEQSAVKALSEGRAFDIHTKRMISCAIGEAIPRDQKVTNIQSWQSDDLSIICHGIKDYMDGYEEARMIGWNVVKFDLTEIIKSFRLTNTKPWRCSFGKWDLIDLAAHPYRGMKAKDVARAFGIQAYEIDGIEVHGDSVASLYEQGRWEDIKAYNESDVMIEGSIFNATVGFITF